MITEQEAIALLKKHQSSDEVFEKILNHVQCVKGIALRIAEQCKGVDVELVRIGSLLHDIGRFKAGVGAEKLKHGILGAEIVRKEGLPESLARICERHIGAGITKEEIVKKHLPLPAQDFLPQTKEEKIIAHADNLTFGSVEKPFSAVVERFTRELPEHVHRFIKLKEEVEAMMHE